jgi:hypothetical protein
MARPHLKLDEKLIEELAGVGCTVPDIARICDCSNDTIERNYGEALERGRANTRASIRRKQFEIAMNDEHKGQATMLVWLGKILCDQWEAKTFLSKMPDDLLQGELDRRRELQAAMIKPAVQAIDLSERVKAIKGEK